MFTLVKMCPGLCPVNTSQFATLLFFQDKTLFCLYVQESKEHHQTAKMIPTVSKEQSNGVVVALITAVMSQKRAKGDNLAFRQMDEMTVIHQLH